MRRKYGPEVEAARITKGDYASDPGDEHGLFSARSPSGSWLKILVGGGKAWAELALSEPAWEHVSVSAQLRCPSWEDMCWVRGLFWDDDEWVVQFHPAKSDYVNDHPFVLHLWRPIGVGMPKPPIECV